MNILLIDPPTNFRETLGDLPPDVKFQISIQKEHDLIIWFVKSTAQLADNISTLKQVVEPAGIWIAWREGSSGKTAGLNQNFVRQTGLQNSLLDYKICSIDTTWSALKFQIRK
ncbi:MAG: hypothetical protein JW784_04025 [Candidatus Cloacimonetes bacterium]|nr:hypothetical protein [Candidatus Cloacimonadota bacterium]